MVGWIFSSIRRDHLHYQAAAITTTNRKSMTNLVLEIPKSRPATIDIAQLRCDFCVKFNHFRLGHIVQDTNMTCQHRPRSYALTNEPRLEHVIDKNDITLPLRAHAAIDRINKKWGECNLGHFFKSHVLLNSTRYRFIFGTTITKE